MTASTVKMVLEQRLIRGTKVIVADSFEKAQVRGKTLVVASKQPVPCKRGGRCAGNWCVGLAVFAAPGKVFKKDKKLAWRTGAHKICLTHLLDEEGELLLPPPAVSVGQDALSEPQVVTWEDLANAAADQDLHTLICYARTLKKSEELLLRKLVAAQEERIAQLLE